MFVLHKDIENEIKVLRFLSGKIPELRGYILKRNIDPVALFDFTAKGDPSFCIEIKTRSINPYKYDNFFLSKDKAHHMQHCPNRHILIYNFDTFKTVFVFLCSFEDLVPDMLEFYNERAGEYMAKDIYKIPADLLNYKFTSQQ